MVRGAARNGSARFNEGSVATALPPPCFCCNLMHFYTVEVVWMGLPIQAAELHAPGLVLDCMCGRLAVPNPGLDFEPYPSSFG